MTEHTHTTSRRTLLAAAPAALALSGTAVIPPEPPNPDAELIALCAEFHRLHAAGADEVNPGWEEANAAAWDAFDQLDDMTPATEAGHRAKARVAVKMLAMFNDGQEGGNPEAVFALHMLRGWLGSAGA